MANKLRAASTAPERIGVDMLAGLHGRVNLKLGLRIAEIERSIFAEAVF